MSKALPSKLAKTLEQLRSDHPLPSETIHVSESDLDLLLLPLRKLEAGAWNKFCLHLDTRLEVLIFPALAKVTLQTERERLLQLCRLRCSWLLYERGWNAFQEQFPDRGLQLAFAEIYAMLRKEPGRYGEAPPYVTDYLPARVDFSLPADLLLQRTYEVLRDHFEEQKDKLSGLSAEAVPAQQAAILLSFFKHYDLNYHFKFGSALMATYFLEQKEPFFYTQKNLFNDISPNLSQETYIKFLNRISQSKLLSEHERTPLFEILFHTLEQSPNGMETWMAIPKRSRQALLRWHIWHVITQHNAMNPTKESVMQHLYKAILDVSEVDAQTVIFRFQDFAIVDSWNDMDHSYYYPQSILNDYLKRREWTGVLNDPCLPYRQLSRDNFSHSAAGVVKLGFVQPQLELSIQFLCRLTGLKLPGSPVFAQWR